MCSISGFYDVYANFLANKNQYEQILHSMNDCMRHRGPDSDGIYLDQTCGLAHTRLAIIDLEHGSQPMTKTLGDWRFTIVFNGEIYNLPFLKQQLAAHGWHCETTSDTEVLLLSFLYYGPDFIRQVDGIFSIAIFDGRHNTLYLYRDYFGVKPLFYTKNSGTFVFSSEPKGLFCFPGVTARLDKDGLNEIFGLGPARTPGSGIFQSVHEVLPGHYLSVSAYGIHDTCYEALSSHPHEDDFTKTVEKTRFLITDALQRQLVSDVPVCTFLSGGVDSSLVSSLCAKELAKTGQTLSTYSFDFTDNEKYFFSNHFQPSQDRPYVEEMVRYLGTSHTYLECDPLTQLDYLEKSVDAHDFPCMADVDSSLLYFCSLVAKQEKVVLTGECADEVFGGYPWFHDEDLLNCGTFPWTRDLSPRMQLLSPELLAELDMENYVKNAYENALSQVQVLPEEDDVQTNRRRIGYLNIRFFMQTLLNRMDRTSMFSGLEARVPFADKALVDYIYNTPWEMKAPDGMVKGLLREAARGLLPDGILFRRKSPYPKTYHPQYETLLSGRLNEVLHDTGSPLRGLLNAAAAASFAESPKDYSKPWYGQLMAGPQMMAYLLQVDYFLRKYKVALCL